MGTSQSNHRISNEIADFQTLSLDEYKKLSQEKQIVEKSKLHDTIYNTNFTNKIKDSSEFFWFTISKKEFEKRKEQIKILFYGKVYCELLNPKDCSLKIFEIDNNIEVYVFVSNYVLI